MDISTLSSTSSFLRIGGLASGLDTDSIVKQLMKAERIPLDRLNQKQQTFQWRKDRYREMTNLARDFYDSFFDVLNPSTNMLSTSAYKKFSVTSSTSSIVDATASSTAISTVHKITDITSLASAANVTGTAVTSPVVGSAAPAMDFTGANQFNITLNGVTKTITLRNGAYGAGELLTNASGDGIQDLINNAFGSGKITVTDTGAGLKFEAPNSTMTLTSGATNDALALLNFNTGISNRLNVNDTLQNLQTRFANNLTFGGAANDEISFTINGNSFTFKNTDSLNHVMSTINSSQAGVQMTYSSVTDSFNITAKQKGSGNNIVITNGTGNFFGAGSATTIAEGAISNGTDAVFSLDGNNNIIRNDNTFTIDGVTYTLKNTFNDPVNPITITVGQDTDAIYNNIKSFIDKYNDLIGKVNSVIDEKYDRNYPPLTDDQKASMKDTDIAKWEAKAKTGLLHNDPLLEKMVNSMRSAIYDTVSGVAGVISDLGITTGYYKDKGKLTIDEAKLKSAIQADPDKVANMFSQKSTINYSPNLTPADRKTRYDNEGIAYRLYDIIQDNIRVGPTGKEGFLLDKAGIEGDVSEFTNSIDKDMYKNLLDINNLTQQLNKKEQDYYKKFTAMETAISKMNSQSSWLAQQFGGGSNQ